MVLNVGNSKFLIVYLNADSKVLSWLINNDGINIELNIIF
jgi:hypothetical protein